MAFLHSNKAIKEVWNSIKGVGENFKKDLDERVIKVANKRGEVENATKAREANGGNFSNLQRAESLFYNSETGERELLKRGGIAIAGGYMGLSAAGRIASGGGLYRDSDGNFDLMGIPFI